MSRNLRVVSRQIVIAVLAAWLIGCGGNQIGVRPYYDAGQQKYIVYIGVRLLKKQGYVAPEDPYPYAESLIEDELRRNGYCPRGFSVENDVNYYEGGSISYTVVCET